MENTNQATEEQISMLHFLHETSSWAEAYEVIGHLASKMSLGDGMDRDVCRAMTHYLSGPQVAFPNVRVMRMESGNIAVVAESHGTRSEAKAKMKILGRAAQEYLKSKSGE